MASQGAGEFGGDPGLIQPEPHKLEPFEEARIMRAQDPSDPSDGPEAARQRGGAQKP